MQEFRQLTKSQYLIWAGQLLTPEDPLYNMPFRFDLQGKIDSSKFKEAFCTLLDEADALRLNFKLDEEGLPVQFFVDGHSPNHEFHDFSNLTNPQQGLEKFILEKNLQVFSLDDVAYYSALLKLSDSHFVWYLNQHHIITDAWSCGVLYRRLAAIYFQNDSSPELSSYADFLDNTLSQKLSRRREQYWNELLKRPKPSVSLYNSSNPERNSKSNRRHYSLSTEDISRLQQISEEADIKSFTSFISRYSIFMTVLSAYVFVCSQNETVVIGSPALNRPKKADQNASGLFIEFFPIVAEMNTSMSLGELYQQIRKKILEFLSNSGVGLSSPELASYFSCVLNYIHASYGDFGELPASSLWMGVDSIDPNHFLRLHVLDSSESEKIDLVFDLNTKIFPEETQVERIDHFMRIFHAFLKNRSMSISEIELLSDEKKHILHESLRGEEAVIPRLSELLFQKKVWNSASLCMTDSNSEYSYLDVAVRIVACIRTLDNTAYGKDTVVAIYGTRSVDFLCWIYACLATGRTFLSIPYNTPFSRLEYMVKDSEARVLISEDKVLIGDCHPLDLKIVIDPSINQVEIPHYELNEEALAYILFTSGSTGTPKGVGVTRKNLANYIIGALEYLPKKMKVSMPFFTSVGFDLSITSMCIPIASEGSIHVVTENKNGPDASILELSSLKGVNTIKLTPSHLKILQDQDPLENIQVFIVGGENFPTHLAKEIRERYPDSIIFNEYGPTEATVACIVNRFDNDNSKSVPIGKPMLNVDLRIVSSSLLDLPCSIRGELLIGGHGVARSYLNQDELSSKSFVPMGDSGMIYYRSGDIASQDEKGIIHYHGREDGQVKISGHRIELAEIENVILKNSGIKAAAVLVDRTAISENHENCVRCGLPSNYPRVEFNDSGLCELCQNYENYESRVESYFKNLNQLQSELSTIDRSKSDYDCIMLLSGGKDSSYALAKLVDLGFRVLAFTLDNGFISKEALANVKRICAVLNVDHHMAQFDRMNEIFIESLRQFDNVCNGCFKTIYTLSIKLALEKNIPFIVTGLSRGQFFETRLTEELFTGQHYNEGDIDKTILEARKLYHESDEALNHILDNSIFKKRDVFNHVKFLDFYRYTDVELSEMYKYLNDKLPWVRPSDTGRSTNCLINAAGIYVHKQRNGYSNYAFPYSWDVRVGHKNRDESLDEINEVLDEPSVYNMLEEIGFDTGEFKESSRLSAYVVSDNQLDIQRIRNEISDKLPSYMMPDKWVQVAEIPLTQNGKVDNDALQKITEGETLSKEYVEPEDEIQEILHEIWSELLNVSRISIDDRFMALGGHSLIAIRMVAKINRTFNLELKLPDVFLKDSIRTLSDLIEESIIKLMEE